MAQSPLSSPALKPDHVPDSIVYDFDFFSDPGLLADPHERILDLVRNAPPIFWTPRFGGHWMFIGHAANFDAARDPESFTNAVVPAEYIKQQLAKLPPGSPHIPEAVPINMDPPEHTKYRLPLQRVFSPKAMAGLEKEIRQLAIGLINSVAEKKSCEFMSAIAEPLPVQVFLKMLGLPLERMAEYRALVVEHQSDREPDPKKAMLKLRRVADIMRDVVLDRRHNPRNDIISLLWKIEIDGTPASLEDVENFGILLFLAGLDTVINGLGLGLRHLAVDQPLQKDLREHPKLIPEATEELLRRYTFTIPVRRVSKDLDFHGLKFRQNDLVMLFLPAADLDPKEFAHPEKFDLERENKTHIAFNAGPHRCLGSHLARMELQICYEEFLKRIPQFHLDSENPPTFHGGNVIGPNSLHLNWE